MRDQIIPSTESVDIFFRSSGAPVVLGNAVRVLCDAEENYPAWLEAIESARRTIHLEMYIVHNDRIGRRFRDLLVEKARAGVRVRVLYDWFGSLRLSSINFWRPLVRAGGEVRVANPIRLDTFLGLVSRDHRKLLTVDGRVAYVSGLCIGDDWVGDEARGLAPWRDTGVEFVGPGVADAEAVFASAWRLWGDPLPDDEVPTREQIPDAGDVEMRVIAASPEMAKLYRLDLSVANIVRERLWLTDAYFIVTPIYREALCSAAADGVDVRVLVPHTSDIQWIANYSRTQYRRLIASGVRIFEWNGPMVHAKTAVADGKWSRIGSTNLNTSSWIGNWELDVTIYDERIADEMEEIFLEDLTNATEVVITERNKVRLSARPGRRLRRRRGLKSAAGSANRVVKDVRAVGTVFNAAVKGHRVLERNEASTLLVLALVTGGLAALFFWFPKAIAYPVVFFLAWLAVSLLAQGVRLRFGKQPDEPDIGADRGSDRR
jgi:cardiolipin synthase